MTMALAAAGITQNLERIMGFGYLETQQKIQEHYLMWLGMAIVFAGGVIAFIWGFVSFGLPRGMLEKPRARLGTDHICPLKVVEVVQSPNMPSQDSGMKRHLNSPRAGTRPKYPSMDQLWSPFLTPS
jgi:hypothetical protein